jgi:beta-xylosidase
LTPRTRVCSPPGVPHGSCDCFGHAAGSSDHGPARNRFEPNLRRHAPDARFSAWARAVSRGNRRTRAARGATVWRAPRVLILFITVGVTVLVTVGVTVLVTVGVTGALSMTTSAPKADLRSPARIITPGQDAPNPFILVANERYYLYSSETGIYSPEVALRVSTDLVHWSSSKEVLPVLPAWASPGFTWAPDVRRVGGRYVMYFTARVKSSVPATQCIGTATASSPVGPFRPLSHLLVCQLDHRGSIDPRTFVDTNGSLWLHWKSDDNADVNGTSRTAIYAQRLSRDGLRLLGRPAVIFSADQLWEGRIVEAPQMMRVNGHYWVFYSGNWFNEPYYAIGVAECRGPAGPCSKPSRPFVASNAQGQGPGESSLFTDRNGQWIVYAPWAVHYRTDTPRPVALAHIAFNASGPYLTALGGARLSR